MGSHSSPLDKIPTPMDAIFHTYEVMMDTLAEDKLKNNPVDIYVRPPLIDIDILDFYKAESIYEQGLAAKDDFKFKLEALITGKPEKIRKRKP
jgi:NTE family protein